MSTLKESKCKPCSGEQSPLQGNELAQYQDKINKKWLIVNGHHLEREFEFGDFKENMEFVNKVANIAEEEQHHPDFHITYDSTKIVVFTHKIGGLSENDFILAAKIDEL